MYFAYGAITLWGTASQQFLLYRRLITLLPAQTFLRKNVGGDVRILQPRSPKDSVWAFPFSLAAIQGITRVAFPSNEHTLEENATHIVLFSSGY